MLSTRMSGCLLATTLYALFSAPTFADVPSGTKKYDLQYKFAPGEVVRWEVVHQATVKTTIDGTSQTAETVSESVKKWQVSEVSADEIFTIVHSVEYVRMKNDIQGRQPIEFDSRTGATPPAGYELVAKRVGRPLTRFRMDASGEILDRKELAPGRTASTQMTMPLPEESVAIGDDWNFPYELDIPLRSGRTKKIKMRQRFELASVVDDIATIKVATQILTPVNDPEIEAQLVQRRTEGELHFDLNKGRVIRQQIDLDRRVTGFPNESSTMRYRTRFTEKLLDEDLKAAAKPAAGTARQ
ncbi:MAG: hypothetical protein WBF93_07285 [Pirellulales bacterium]